MLAVLDDISRFLSAPLWLTLACLLMMVTPPAQAATPRNVLVLYSHGRLLPANIECDRGLGEAFATGPDLAVVASAEFLDNPRFTGEAYERAFVTYLREKYAAHPPEVIIVAADEALDFMLRHRAALFAQVPIVHLADLSTTLLSLSPLPPDVVGTPLAFDFVSAVEQALRWHPEADRLAIVMAPVRGTGCGRRDCGTSQPAFRKGSPLTSWPACPSSSCSDDCAICRRARSCSPLDSSAMGADASSCRATPPSSSRPRRRRRSTPFSTLIGTGIVGGRMASYDAMGASAHKPRSRCSMARPRLRWTFPRPCLRRCTLTGGNYSAGAFHREPCRRTRSCISGNPHSGRATDERYSRPAS